MTVKLTINGQDMAPILAEYTVTKEVRFDKVVTTLDGTEHPLGRTSRDVLEFKLWLSLEGLREDYKILTAEELMVEYDDPDTGYHKRRFRLDCDLSKSFELHSAVFNTNVWSSGTIRLRCLEVDRNA